MKRYVQAVTHAKWYDGPPPEPKLPSDDGSFQLIAVVPSGSTIAFYWQKDAEQPRKEKT